MNKNQAVVIYEVLYDKARQDGGSNVQPLEISNSNPEWRELQAYVEAYSRGIYNDAAFTGVFSPKFSLKTKIGVRDFENFVERNNEVDVCFINPFPQISYWSFNVWMQGEYAHPGLTECAQSLLEAVGISLGVGKSLYRHDPAILSYSNFWVASPRFWKAYVGSVLKPIAQFLTEEPDHPASRKVLKPTLHTDPAPYLPFIVERLFSTFLALQKDVQFVSYSFTSDEIIQNYCLNDFEKLLVQRMEREVQQADMAKYYSSELISKMDLLTCLHQRHYFDYFQSHIHPHTGRLMELG